MIIAFLIVLVHQIFIQFQSDLMQPFDIHPLRLALHAAVHHTMLLHIGGALLQLAVHHVELRLGDGKVM